MSANAKAAITANFATTSDAIKTDLNTISVSTALASLILAKPTSSSAYVIRATLADSAKNPFARTTATITAVAMTIWAQVA
jgi:hypothetical protein